MIDGLIVGIVWWYMVVMMIVMLLEIVQVRKARYYGECNDSGMIDLVGSKACQPHRRKH